ncbi:helix-turn-helix domain-containing protein [Clostridioides difficile]|nr:helix-turn-helix domain-containing protein [Clostridioides difficile]
MAKKVNNSGYYKVKEVAELLDVAESTAYRIMRDLNKELQKKVIIHLQEKSQRLI